MRSDSTSNCVVGLGIGSGAISEGNGGFVCILCENISDEWSDGKDRVIETCYYKELVKNVFG